MYTCIFYFFTFYIFYFINDFLYYLYMLFTFEIANARIILLWIINNFYYEY